VRHFLSLFFLIHFFGSFATARSVDCETRLTKYNLAETLWNDFVENQEAGRGPVLTRQLYSNVYEKMGRDIKAARRALLYWTNNNHPTSHQVRILSVLGYFQEKIKIQHKQLLGQKFVSNIENAALAYDVSLLNAIFRSQALEKLFVVLKKDPSAFAIGKDVNHVEYAFAKLMGRVDSLLRAKPDFPTEYPEILEKLVRKQPHFLLLPTYLHVSIAKLNDWTVFPTIPLGMVQNGDEEFPIAYGYLVHDAGHGDALFNSFGSEEPLSLEELKIKVRRRLAIREHFLSENQRPYETWSRRLFEFTWFRAIHEVGVEIERPLVEGQDDYLILKLAQPLPGEERWHKTYFLNRLPQSDEVEIVVRKLSEAQSVE